MIHHNPTIVQQQKTELAKLGSALHTLTTCTEESHVLAYRILESCNYITGAESLEEALDIRFQQDFEFEISIGLQVLVSEINARYQYHCGCMTELALQVLANGNLNSRTYDALANHLIKNLVNTSLHTILDQHITPEQPKAFKIEHINYLDHLRLEGTINMMGAAPYLQQIFDELSPDEAREIHLYWIATFGSRRNSEGKE